MTADSIDLVYKNNTRSTFLSLFKEIANAARTDPDKHLDKIRSADGKERNPGFACDSPCKQRLTGSRRT